MEIFENPPVVPEIQSSGSMHPVLQQLKDRISELETQLATNKETSTALDTERVDTIRKVRGEKWAFEERVKNVLIEAIEDHDEDTVRYIAEQLDIELTKTTQFEVNVTFTIDIEHEIGTTPDPEWDFDYTVSGSDIVDYSADVVWSKQA